MQAVREILGTSGVSKKTERLILLLLEHGRLNLLGAICGLFPILWNEKKGVSSFEVRSAVPLTEEQREALKARLEEMEKRSVSLSFRIDPEIIGGLYLRRGNIVYDASIRGSLAGLMEKMTEG
jgi:F-type H+-transporting ATPase subunit delta